MYFPLSAPKEWARVSLVLALVLSLARPLIAQPTDYFPYYSSDTTTVFKLASDRKMAAKKMLAPPKGVSSDYKKDLNRFLGSASDHAFYSIRYSALLDSEIDPFVQQIYHDILKANPGLPPTRLVVTRNPIPNASALLDGTILFNVGLISRLENESQLAAVLCHELAHVVSRHVEKGIFSYLDRVHSKDFKKDLKAIEKEEFNTHDKLRKLIMGMSMNTLYHKRSHESQADSLGYVLLTNTRFDASQAYTMLQLLDVVDEPYLKEGPAYAQFFGCQHNTVAFGEQAKKTNSIFQVVKEENALEKSDTLKTHPDCKKRMDYIQQLMAGRTVGATQANDARFAHIKHLCRMETVQSWFDLQYYDYALFDALQLLQAQPNNGFLQSMVLLSLYELKRYQLMHDYAQVVSNISEGNSDAFNRFLRTLHELQLSDIRNLSTCFTQLAAANLPENEYGTAARYARLALVDEKAEADKAKADYLSRHKGGRFEKLIAPKPKTKRK